MTRCKSLLLHAYYYGSCPIRSWSHRRAVAGDRVPGIVLFYHRVADDRANEWTTSPRTFTRQIRWLRDHFELVSLEEVQRLVRCGANRRRCVSITFDDGYADNGREAIPRLIEQGIPCTYFVTVRNVLRGEPFEHDLVRGRPLAPNTLEQLQAMAAAGVEIAAHTYTHADLGRLADRRQLRHEVVAAGRELQSALGRPVRYFAFPFGQHANLSRAAFALAYEAGYEAVCSAYGGFNFPGDDPFHLQRIAVGDDMIHLKNWVTVDPRKRHTPRFVYQIPEGSRPAEDRPERPAKTLADGRPLGGRRQPEAPVPSHDPLPAGEEA